MNIRISVNDGPSEENLATGGKHIDSYRAVDMPSPLRRSINADGTQRLIDDLIYGGHVVGPAQ